MGYRIEANELLNTLGAWDELIPGRVKIHLIACGGTALTLLGYKESTKDVDFIVPDEKEYERLTRFLKQAGYAAVTGYGWKRADETILFDLYAGKKVYTTELLTSPLIKDGNIPIREWKKIYLGVLNPFDLVISKMFRGAQVDIEDSLILIQKHQLHLGDLEKRYKQTAQYDVSEAKVLKNFDVLIDRVKGLKK